MLVSKTVSSLSPGFTYQINMICPVNLTLPQSYLELAPMQGASIISKATQKGKGCSNKAAAALTGKKKPVVLSSGSESEEEEEESRSEDEAEGLEIERVLHGRRNADIKQEDFLVKFKGDSVCQ